MIDEKKVKPSELQKHKDEGYSLQRIDETPEGKVFIMAKEIADSKSSKKIEKEG